MSLVVLAGWAEGLPALVEVNPHFPPMHYNTALAGLAWGAGLLAAGAGRRRPARACGLLLLAFAALSLGHTFGLMDLGLGRWVVAAGPWLPAFPPGGTQPAAAVVFAVAGVALILSARGAAAFGAALAVYGLGWLAWAGLGPATPAPPAPLFVLLGASAGGLAFVAEWLRQRPVPFRFAQAVPAAIVACGSAVSLMLWRATDEQQQLRLGQKVQFETAHLKYFLEGRLPELFGVPAEAARDGKPPARWPPEDPQTQPGCLGVAAVAPDGRLSWPAGVGNTLPATLVEAGLEAPLREARSAGRAAACLPARSRWAGLRVIAFFSPTPGSGGAGGLGVFHLRELLDGTLSGSAADYALSITAGGEPVYERGAADQGHRDRWGQSLPVRLPGLDWQVNVWPTREAMTREGVALPELGLGVGLLTTLLLAAATHQARSARSRARVLEREVAERHQAEAALRQSEARYRSLAEHLEQPVFLKDTRGRYLAVNEAYCRDRGVREQELLGGTDARDPSVPALDPWEREVVSTGKTVEVEAESGPAGARRVVRRVLTPVTDAGASITGVLGICWDVTAQRALEAQARQASKMDAIGQLAGGIAHDFNNLLTAMIGYLELAQKRLAPDDETRQLVGSAQGAAARAASLTGQLLGFARQQPVAARPTELRAVVAEVVALLTRTIDPRIRIDGPNGPEWFWVAADPGQLNQVLMNLCLNARDAISGSGTIAIDLTGVRLTDADLPPHAGAGAGRYVRLRVTDSGCGIPAAIRSRIFEPFFTTKPVGKGTGLGLAMVFSIVKQQGGWVECHSEPGRGTRFDVYLRQCDAQAEPEAAPPTDETAPVGGATVLVAEDEPMVRTLAAIVLRGAGFEVLEAADGREAVEVFARQPGRVDLVLLDLTMPNLSGREAFREMCRIRPGVRVLFASGYTAEEITPEEEGLTLGFVKKPYRPGELVRAVTDALAAGGKPVSPRGVREEVGYN